jgi:hypothetical protein
MHLSTDSQDQQPIGKAKMNAAYKYEEVIIQLVEHDVSKWGEQERDASNRLRRKNNPTLGLAMNSLAHLDPENIDRRLADEAKKIMTAKEWKSLRQ